MEFRPLSEEIFKSTIADKYAEDFYKTKEERTMRTGLEAESAEKIEMLRQIFLAPGVVSSFFDRSRLPDEDCECLVYYGDSSDIRYFDKLYFRVKQAHFYFDADCKNESTLEEYDNHWYAWLKLPCSVMTSGEYIKNRAAN